MKVGTVVCSKAGRDKGCFYAVVKSDGDGVFVADGNKRKISNPKMKNEKHLAVTKTVVDLSTDKSLFSFLKNYGKQTAGRKSDV